jgi:hypothetical protein
LRAGTGRHRDRDTSAWPHDADYFRDRAGWIGQQHQGEPAQGDVEAVIAKVEAHDVADL